MGGKTSKQADPVHAEDFEEVPNQYRQENSYEEYSVVVNRASGKMFDRYQLYFPNQQSFKEYMELAKFRRDEENIVRVHYIIPHHRKEFCSTSYEADVYLEHCHARLSEYKDIPYPDNLYCMMAMLNGYEKLSGNFGGFQVSQRQVLIDEEGQVRVWCNSDFSKFEREQGLSYPSRGTHKSWDDEKFEMVDNIIRTIVESTDQNDGPQLKFVDFYQREKINFNGRVGFEEAKGIITDYSHFVNMKIPDCFESVLEIYQDENNDMENILAPNLLNEHNDRNHLMAMPRVSSQNVNGFGAPKNEDYNYDNSHVLKTNHFDPPIPVAPQPFASAVYHNHQIPPQQFIRNESRPFVPQPQHTHQVFNIHPSNLLQAPFQPQPLQHPYPQGFPVQRINPAPQGFVQGGVPHNHAFGGQVIYRPPSMNHPHPQVVHQTQQIHHRQDQGQGPAKPQYQIAQQSSIKVVGRKASDEELNEQIERNVLNRSGNVFGVSEENVMNELQQFKREESSKRKPNREYQDDYFEEEDEQQESEDSAERRPNYDSAEDSNPRDREQSNIQAAISKKSSDYSKEKQINVNQNSNQQRVFTTQGPFQAFNTQPAANWNQNNYNQWNQQQESISFNMKQQNSGQKGNQGGFGMRFGEQGGVHRLMDNVPLNFSHEGPGSVKWKEVYYTLNNEVELDPEIAADLRMFSAGSLAV